MRITIELRGRSTTARLLPEIPPFAVGLLQGYNGIGKSLTIRLLEVLTGTLPYPPGEPAWGSMCRVIGPATVTASELDGGSQIRWSFDTSKWIGLGHVVTDDWFDALTANGRPIDLATVRRTLLIHRLGGDETLIDSLAQMVDAHRARVDRLATDLIRPEGRLQRADSLLDEAQLILERVQPARLGHDRTQLLRLADEARSLREREAAVATSLDALQKATEARRQIEILRLRAPELETQMASLNDRIVQLERQRANVDSQLRLQTQRAAVSDTVRKELENARRTRDRNRSRLQAEMERLSAAVSALAISANEEIIDEALEACAVAIAELEERKDAADSVPQLRTTLDGIRQPLSEAISRGLAARELLELHSRAVSVAELADAANERRTALEGLPPPPEVRELNRLLEENRRRQARLQEVPEIMGTVDRYARLTEQQEARLNALIETGALQASDRLKELERKRVELDRQILEVANARAAAIQQRSTLAGGVTEAQLERDLQECLAIAGSALETLSADFANATQTLASIRRGMTDVDDNLRSIRADIERQEAELRELWPLLRNDGDWGWLTSGRTVPDIAADDALDWLADVQRRVGKLRERLGGLRNTLIGVSNSLQSISGELRGQERRETLYEGALRHWLSDRFSEYFDQPLLREYLFPGGTDVRVDIASRQVTWKAAGRAHSRPLSAFSSGEQAFAYTQARLAGLDARDDASVNRLIVLDEFGSFIAENRLQSLYDLLLARRRRHPKDQVLIILPLRDDFKALAETRVGIERDALLELAERLEEQQYAVQDLT